MSVKFTAADPARPSSGRAHRPSHSATGGDFALRKMRLGKFVTSSNKVYSYRWVVASLDYGDVKNSQAAGRNKRWLRTAKHAKASVPAAEQLNDRAKAMPVTLASPDARIGAIVNPAAIAGSGFLVRARACLDALPSGFSDDLFAAPVWPDDVPEIMGPVTVPPSR